MLKSISTKRKKDIVIILSSILICSIAEISQISHLYIIAGAFLGQRFLNPIIFGYERG